jgi:small-conductance mechanosensitive channel
LPIPDFDNSSRRATGFEGLCRSFLPGQGRAEISCHLEALMRSLAVLLLRQATTETAVEGDGNSDSLFRDAAGIAWDQVVDLLKWIGGFSINLLWAGLIVVAFVWLTGRLRRRIRIVLEARTKGRNNLPALLDNMLQIGVYIVAALFAFTALGADSSAFVQAVGLITAAVSLSLQDVLKNFVAGLYLLAEEPFSTGDRLEVSGQVGTVEQVNVRTTVIRNDKAQQVLVPNYQVFSTIVINRTTYQLRSLTFEVTGIKDDFEDVLTDRDLWFEDVAGLSTTPPTIELTKVGPDGCELTVTVWLAPGGDLRREVVQRLRTRFPDATLTITN